MPGRPARPLREPGIHPWRLPSRHRL